MSITIQDKSFISVLTFWRNKYNYIISNCLVELNSTRPTSDGQAVSVNSTCHLKLPFKNVSSCHTNPSVITASRTNNGQQSRQATTVLILLQFIIQTIFSIQLHPRPRLMFHIWLCKQLPVCPGYYAGICQNTSCQHDPRQWLKYHLIFLLKIQCSHHAK